MLVNPVQFWNALLPMVVPLVIAIINEEGFACRATELVFVAEPVMLFKPLQPEKAELPMLVTLSGIVTLISPVQLSKA